MHTSDSPSSTGEAPSAPPSPESDRGPAAGSGLTVRDATVTYRTPSGDDVLAVEGASFTVAGGAFASIVGPSGCGKTSLLNVFAGLIDASKGDISFNGRPITGPSSERAMVFQVAALLPWRSLLDNVIFGAELQRQGSRRELRERARSLIELVGLSGKESLYPHQLSGGMQQRGNLARALMLNPQLLLLDEPFAALDAYTRDTMQEELERIASSINATVLLVTHQISEAVYLSNTVVVMAGTTPGRVLQIFEIEEKRPRGFEWRNSDFARDLERDISLLLRPTVLTASQS